MLDKDKTRPKVAVFCPSARLQCTGADRVAAISRTAEAQVRDQGKTSFVREIFKARTLSEQQAISWTQEPANGSSSNTKASGGCPEMPSTGLDEHYRQQLGTTSSSGLQTGFHKCTPTQTTITDSRSTSRTGSGFVQRNPEPGTKGSNHKNSQNRRILQSNIHCTEEGWWLAASDKPESIEQVGTYTLHTSRWRVLLR